MAATPRTTRSSARRRQRSVRVTVAVALLGLATVVVLVSLPTQSPALLSTSAVLAIVLGWAALRMVWTEVLQSRRENAADRASAANAYKSLFSERAAEHAEFTTAMTERLAAASQAEHELQGALVQARTELASVLMRAEGAETSLAGAKQRVNELEESIEVLRAEVAEASVGIEPAPGSLEDLVGFDEKVARATQPADSGIVAKLA